MEKFIVTNDVDFAATLSRYFVLVSEANNVFTFINDLASEFYSGAFFDENKYFTTNILTF